MRSCARNMGSSSAYSWVKLALQGAGLVAKVRRKGANRHRRARRPLPGTPSGGDWCCYRESVAGR